MKKFILSIILLDLVYSDVMANGVAIIDAVQGIYLKLTESSVSVVVNNQVAIIKTAQTFQNLFNEEKAPHYAFPLPEEGSATNLRWFVNGEWFEAYIAPGGGGSGSNQTLSQKMMLLK